MTEPKVEEIFHAALEKGAGTERDAFLDGACGRDARLRARVDALLKAHEEEWLDILLLFYSKQGEKIRFFL